jgi:hypothetical protein
MLEKALADLQNEVVREQFFSAPVLKVPRCVSVSKTKGRTERIHEGFECHFF